MTDNKTYIKKFQDMQKSTVKITRFVASKIRSGMSELDIANLYAQKLANAGLKSYWYPILVYVGEITATPMSRKFHLPQADIFVKTNDIVILDCTPFKENIWSNWAETFLIGKNEFYEVLINDTRKVVNETYDFAISKAKTIGDIFDYCNSRIKYYGLISLDSRNDVGHSIFQVPEGQTVDQTPESNRLFISEEYKNSKISGIISIEPQLGRKNPENEKMYGAKMQKIIIK